ncbi:MAG: hypothetical protein SW833_06790 [Cyanobacteriota bacterium]|nr:hypothetical protein [Cyanobacteriota bacterium]
MRDWTSFKERYLRDELPIRLGNLASNLARIKSRCQNIEYRDLVEDVIQESKFFIEWTAGEAEIETAAELVELQIQLSRWHYRWSTIWNDPEQRVQVSEKAKVWSDRVLEMSGLLSD